MTEPRNTKVLIINGVTANNKIFEKDKVYMVPLFMAKQLVNRGYATSEGLTPEMQAQAIIPAQKAGGCGCNKGK